MAAADPFPQPAPRPDSAGVPDGALHGPLAYRPDRPVPLRDVPPDYYVVQLLAVESKEALEEYATRKELHGMSAARVERDGRLFYVLLLGVYSNRQRAEAASANLPVELAQFDPWVRRVESLQRAMVRGDELAGTTEI